MGRRLALAAIALLLVLPAARSGTLTARAVDCGYWDGLCQDLNDAKGNQQEAAQHLTQIQGQIRDTQGQVNALVVELKRLNAQVAAQEALVARTQAQIDETDRQIRFQEAEIARMEAHLSVRLQLLDQRVRAMDKHGAVNYFELVVTSRSFNQLVDRVVIMQDIVRGDRQLLEQLRQERDQLQRLQAGLRAKRAQQAQLLATQQQQKAQLDATVQSRQRALDYFKTLEAQYEEQRHQVEAEKARIDALVLVLQKQYDDAAKRAGGGSGQFIWPEAVRDISQGYGCSTLLGEPFDAACPSRHRHTGIDIAGPDGEPIHAADYGIVAQTVPAPGGGYGNFVIIAHGNGYATLYAHMSRYIVRQGQPVRRGDVIGSEGSTGYSTGPHLHFEIRYNGDYSNPCAYLGC